MLSRNLNPLFKPTEKTAKGLRKEGFGTVLTFRADGIARGTSSMVTLGDDTPNKVMLNPSPASLPGRQLILSSSPRDFWQSLHFQ